MKLFQVLFVSWNLHIGFTSYRNYDLGLQLPSQLLWAMASLEAVSSIKLFVKGLSLSSFFFLVVLMCLIAKNLLCFLVNHFSGDCFNYLDLFHSILSSYLHL